MRSSPELNFMTAHENQYSELLDNEMRYQSEGDERHVQLCRMRDSACEVYAAESNGSKFELVYPRCKASDTTGPEEMVFRVQGFVTQAYLPPIVEQLKATSVSEGVRQSIEITGLGARRFDKAVNAHWILMDTLVPFVGGKDRINTSWNPAKGHYHSYPTMTIANRYFTSPQEAKTQPTIAFSDQVDPLSVLQNYGNKYHLKHTEDNEVQYFERSIGRKGPVFRTIAPGFIQPTNMVEVQLGVCAQRLGVGKYIFLMKMRSVCVLNRVVKEAFTSLPRLPMAVESSVQIKRKVGYTCDSEWSDSSSSDDESVASDPEFGRNSVSQGMKRLKLRPDGEGDDSEETEVETICHAE
ncbi:hypothetical protein EIP91_004526 [Steccherinum ochraceum]|uniref:Uncharacterized protein n=1 Tax=Steccherinum ochraceum TaxID=92696 RepID=A0A4R0RBR5_9APHY|nr:hypothetical protein EIP91_004526 [Steccherinum ochraceum]